ncbi:hypothetical protein [Yersinia phage fHe-Yen9-03]|uniref:Uncharacterized protein n=1 Tax=Yersinia phage fHe-Yen9-03 TaxID=2052743 RepID=A0A2C9D108_9CAUD|nr:hypothetical protein [Yersinia phage fHe-Yen9-03]
MSSNVKLIFINGIGPLIGTIQDDVSDAIVVRNPCQFGLDDNGEFVIRDYLEGITNPNENVIFMKYNIVSVNVPDASIAAAYVEAIEALEASEEKSRLIVPDNKIII